MRAEWALLGLLLVVWWGPLAAQPVSLLGDRSHPKGLSGAREGLFKVALVEEARPAGSSLFVGRVNGGLFEVPPKEMPNITVALPQQVFRGSDVEVIRQIIQSAESRREGYDAVQHGARVRPSKRPTQMTVAQIYKWIDETPGQPHAIGRYQFIPKTLKAVMRKVGANPKQVFSPQLQDQLADVLLAEAGLHRVRAGKMTRQAFMNNLAKIWAGLPNSSGQSHYHGYAGNKASMSWASFEAQMMRVFPG